MRFVIKVGTALLTTEDYQLNREFLRELVAQIAAVKNQGHEIVIVTSGAVAAGRSKICFIQEKKNIPYRQVFAAIGQGLLMRAYERFFRQHGVVVAQALLTNYDFVNRESFLNMRNVFDLILEKGVVPIVNENDVTTVSELKFGDNDMLSAKTAAAIAADFLIICTDVDGLYSEDPRNNPNAKLVPCIEKVTDAVRKCASGAQSGRSLGGMITKLEAANYVASVGIPTFITSGKKAGQLENLVQFLVKYSVNKEKISTQEYGTFFWPYINKMQNQKKWLRAKTKKGAWVEIDDGALKALVKNGKSLLPSGIVKVHGKFERGDVISVKHDDTEVAYGQVNYSSEDVDKIKKHHCDEIELILGFNFADEVIHRDRMAVIG